ncbi:carboxyvinyl-carboxyphosphonate phosphorylmutase [Burkholderia cepacia]|uniref:Carboxyvinyl-carboxyphosphonate phosphorylmutase n=1 Tax=Burkholderia cepacia TaxID=292 RepID=A0A2S8IP08_BURCE|nr:isocitrate lyase/PEP mutase family protein [Burkholderia cepacia]PQP16507.1 carboxyvinyl-carboxyphosphonate phosphorylmutase [Burkholderia cepacia]HDR9508473.1 isocitrate lyase/PEP mutase family protein [Burkholderia cepacia]
MKHSLNERLKRPGIVVAPGCHDVLGARIVARAGFEAVYMTGNGLSASLIGAPDLGLLTMSEMVERGRAFADAVDIPVIADADTGYGNVNNVRRTVRAYEAAGVAAIHLEDQVTPKRCGAMEGLVLVSPDEHVEKIRAACSARTESSMLIIGRTDARIPNGFADALARGRAYARAGADLVLIEMLQSENEIAEAVRSIDAPLMFNFVDGKVPPLTAAQFGRLGVKLLSFPVSSTLAYAQMMTLLAAHIRAQGTTAGSPQPLMSLAEYEAALGKSDYA